MSGTGVGAVGLALIGAASACGDNLGAPDAAPPVDAGVSAVTGTLSYTFHREAGEPQTIPGDLSDVRVAAWVSRADRGWREIPGTGADDGRFFIDRVPEEPVYIQIGALVLHTAERSIDLGRDLVGRPDRDYTDPDALLRIDAGGMAPWKEGDSLALLSSNMGYYLPFLEEYASPPLAPGTTSLAGVEFVGSLPLVDAGRGDRASIFHITAGERQGLRIREVIGRLDLDPVTFGSSETSVAGVVEPIERAHTLALDWNAGAWRAAAGQVHPDALGSTGTLRLLARPVPTDFLLFEPEVLAVYGVSSADLSIAYGDPFPAGWERTVDASVAFYVAVSHPDGGDGYLFGEMRRSMSLDELAAGSLSVAISPPRRPMIDGAVAYGGRTGVGTSPELSWQPPGVGVAAGYRIEVVRLEPFDDFWWPSTVATVLTADTAVVIPPGLVTPGEPHAFILHALARGEGDPVARPFRAVVPAAEAPAVTGVFVP